MPYILVFVLAIAQYANTRNHDFAWDDAIVLTENSRVQKGWANIPELFENIKSEKTENRYGYRPISLLSFATDVQFFGLNSKASHRINIILYAILCMIIFLFLQQMFPAHKWQNFLATLLFIVHPLHTEVVANIKSRDEILAMSFGLLAMLFFLRALKHTSPLNYIPVLIFLAFAFLSKENAIIFCGVAFLLAWYKTLPTTTQKDWTKRIGFIALSLIALIGIRRFVYSSAFFQTSDQELISKGVFLQEYFVGNPLVSLDHNSVEKWLNIIYLGVFQLYKFIIPYPLVHDYGYNYLQLVDATDYRAYVAVIIAAAMIVVTVIAIIKRTIIGFGLGFFVIAASVYLHIVGVAPDIFAERFLFISSLGLCVAVVGVTFLIKNPRLKAVVFTFWFAVLVLFFSLGWNRNEAWKNNETLLQTDLQVLKNGARINYNYALLLHQIYYNLPATERPAMQDSIIHYYKRTTEITNKLFPAYIDLGSAYMEFNQPEKAKGVFLKAIENYPQLSVPYVQMGKYHMSLAQYAEAIPYLKKAIELGTENVDFYYLLSICQFNTGQQQEALKTLQAGESYDDAVNAAYFVLKVRLYINLGQIVEAKETLTRGLALFPNHTTMLQMKEAIETGSAQ